MNEMVARSMKTLIECVILSNKVPDSASTDVHLMQRILMANAAIENLLTQGKSFIADSLMPVLREKFVVPQGYTVPYKAIHANAVMAVVKRKLGVSLDSTAKQLLRFTPSRLLRSSIFVRPKCLGDGDAEKVVEQLENFANELTVADSVNNARRAHATQFHALHLAFLAKSPRQDEIAQTLLDGIEDLSNPADDRTIIVTTGTVAECTPNSVQLEELCEKTRRETRSHEETRLSATSCARPSDSASCPN